MEKRVQQSYKKQKNTRLCDPGVNAVAFQRRRSECRKSQGFLEEIKPKC